MSKFTELGYVGDGVYLSFDGYQYWLAVGNHENKVVAFEPTVFRDLVAKVGTHRAQLAKESYDAGS